MTNDINLTIGSDPEFVIMCGDSVENALEIFQKVGDIECQCECPYPDEDDISNIYDLDKAYLIKEAFDNQNKEDLFIDYKDFAIKTIIELYEWHGYGENSIIELIENDIIESDLKKIAVLIKNIVIEYSSGPNYYHKYKKEFENLDNIQKEYIIEKMIYLHLDLQQIYNILSDKKQKTFDDFFLSFIIKEYENKNLEDLPEITRESIKIEIIDGYDVDCSECRQNESYFCTTELGCDAQTALGEMRPKFGNDPIEHFNEILKLMKELNNLLSPEIICYGDDLQVKAGAYQGDVDFETFQLGGHIHLGSVEIEAITISSLADYLSFFCGIPLTLITDTEKKFYGGKSERDHRHEKSQYGGYNSYREKNYGVEFRMPSSWLVSPQITIGALSLAYVVGYEFLTMSPNEQHIWKLRFREEYGIIAVKYAEWYAHQNWVLLQGEFEPIKLEIQKMELYPKYAIYIDHILDMADSYKTWHSERDILPLWAELW